MPHLKTYDLFISHCWNYNAEYHRLKKMLDDAPLFKWRNYSVPDHDPLEARTTDALRRALNRQIRPVNAVLILAGMYAAHSDWISEEITIAQSYRKPIIGITPSGAERIPKAVQDAAIVMVRWNTHSIVQAIRTHAL